MKRVNKSVLTVIIAAVCAPSYATINDTERAAAVEQFQKSAAIYNDASLDINDSRVTEAQRMAIQSLERLGVHSGDIPDMIGNYSYLTTPEAIQSWVPYTLENGQGDALITANANRTATQKDALLNARFLHLKQLKAEQEEQNKQGNQRISANIERTIAQHPDNFAIQGRLTEQNQATRDASQDASIEQAQHTANWASLKADDAHHAILSNQVDIDSNTKAISDNAAAQAMRDSEQDAATTRVEDAAQHANINAAAALKNYTVLSGNVAGNIKDVAANKKAIEHNTSDINNIVSYTEDVHKQVLVNSENIASSTENLKETSNVATANARQIEMMNSDHIQGMLHAKQEAETKATVNTAISGIAANDHAKEIAANSNAIISTDRKVNSLAAQQRVASVYYGEQIQALATDTANAIDQDRSAIRSTQSRVADNTLQLEKLNGNFSKLRSQVNRDRGEYRAGIAAATALAGLPQVNANQTFMVSAAAGTFKEATAIAVGGSATVTEHVVMKFGVSDSSENDLAANVGIGYGF
ncbi:YadA-like family protein [Kosakonia cowanii]|uniref:YadA-like family protein n=1 Tax=Kosakonia cowanii TaxID=208223 RepID=UPI0012FD9CEF|nr:YadA-like family protein [Kosakonia cowanii]